MGEGSEPVPESRAARLVSNTVVRGVAQAASVIASFVLLPFLVRAFTLADYGVFMLASAVTGYAAILDLGLGATLVRMVAERRAKNEESQVGSVVASVALFFTFVGVVAALVMVGIGLLGGSLFAVQPAQAQLLAQLLAIGAVVQIIYWPASAATHALSGFERYDLLSATSIIQTVASVLAVVAVLLLRLGPVALALINAGITLSMSLVLCVLFARIAWGRIGPLRPHLSLVRDAVRSGLPLCSIQLSGLLSRQATDRVVLGVLLGPQAVGIYEIASRLSMLVTQASELLTGAILPIAANMSAREHTQSIRALFVRGARYSVVAITPLIVVLICIARPFIGAWFGPAMAPAVPVAQLLLAAQFFVPLYMVGDPILTGMNRFPSWAGWAFAVALLNVALSVVFVKAFGLIGVAMGTAVATLIEFPLYGRLVVREMRLDWRKWIRQASVPGYPLLVVPILIAVAGAATILGQRLSTLFAVSAVAVTVYWALSWMLVLPKWERAELVTAVSAMVKRRLAA